MVYSYLILEADVAWSVPSPEGIRTIKKAERTQAILNGDEDDLALLNVDLRVVKVEGSRARGKSTAVNPDDDGKKFLRRLKRRLYPFVAVKLITF